MKSKVAIDRAVQKPRGRKSGAGAPGRQNASPNGNGNALKGADSGGCPKCGPTSNGDITERKSAEEALRESEARLKSILDHEPECVKVVALDGRLLEMNPAGLAMIQAASRDMVIGQIVLQLIHPEDRKVFLAMHRKASLGESAVGEFRVIGLHGAVRHLESHSVPLRDAAGRVDSVLSVTRDVTDRKKIETAVRESEQRLRAAMEASLDAFYVEESVRDARGQIVDFRFVDLNSKGAELLKSRREKLIGRSLCEICPWVRSRGFFQKFVAVVESGMPLVEEFAVGEPDVKASWLHQQVVRLGDGIAITARDISERKWAEEAMRRLPRQIIEAQEEGRRRIAQELHDGAGQLLASVRFRIRGAEERVATADPMLRDLLAKAREALEQAVGVTRAMAHRLHPTKLSELGLNGALREVKEEFQERTRVPVTLVVPRQADQQLAPEIQVQLYRMVQEALTNVEKHANARRVAVRLSIRRRRVRLEMSDDGKGLTLNSPTSRSRIAAGLGLAGMQERAKFLGGHFHLDTARRKGMKILVEFPLEPDVKGITNG